MDMERRNAAAFTADLDTVRAFAVSALGGLVEASAVDVQATGAYAVHCWPLDLSSRGSV